MSPEKRVRHVVVHPYAGAPEQVRRAWSTRQSEVDTVVYDRNRGGTAALDSAHFMDDWDRTPTGSIIAVSGQMAAACIKRLLETLVRHPRVKRGMLEIVVEEEATMQSERGELRRVVRQVNEKHGSSVRSVRRVRAGSRR